MLLNGFAFDEPEICHVYFATFASDLFLRIFHPEEIVGKEKLKVILIFLSFFFFLCGIIII